MDDIRKKILDSAKDLFFSQGYNKTTIRQIVDKSGVLIGSIYYFFKNKEEIFKSFALELFNMCDKLVNERFGEDESPAFRYAFMCALELRAVEMNEQICELFFQGYSSNTIMEEVVKYTAERTQYLFKVYNPDFTYEDYYTRTLAIKGIMRNYIANRYLKQYIPLEQRTETFLDISLHTLDVQQNEIEHIKTRISNMNNRLTKMAILLGAKSLYE